LLCETDLILTTDWLQIQIINIFFTFIFFFVAVVVGDGKGDGKKSAKLDKKRKI
jgi:hypothetical protein